MSYFSPKEANALFTEGMTAYGKGDFSAARSAFEKLIFHGLGNADVLYNAGTSALAQGDLGFAVLYLRRAQRLPGHSEDAEANLAIARSRQIDRVVGVPSEASWSDRFAEAGPADFLAIAFALLWALGFTLLGIRLFQVSLNAKAVLRRAGWAALALSIPFGAATAWRYYLAHHFLSGVVVERELPTRPSPTPEGQVSFQMHPGLEVKVLEVRGDFARVRLPNGLEGWAERRGIVDL